MTHLIMCLLFGVGYSFLPADICLARFSIEFLSRETKRKGQLTDSGDSLNDCKHERAIGGVYYALTRGTFPFSVFVCI